MSKLKRKQKPPVKPRKNVGFEEVVGRLEDQGRPFDRELLRAIYDFTVEKHRDQKRRSGEPYVIHPIYVAYLLADLKFDPLCVAVGFLHDVLEDTLTSKEVLEKEFGVQVADLVDGVTKISKQEYIRRDDAQAETFRKMILASARDLRVILVKLADRLHNMMTLEHMPPEKKRRISGETLEIYAPIAHRLGMSRVQGDLEDLAFFHRYPHQFTELEAKLKEKMRVGKDGIRRIRDQLEKSLTEAGLEAEITYRVKRFYSIFAKLRRQGIDISQLYDYLAFRVITEDVRSTYTAFGVVHQNWRPIPGRFKDYIAMPKPNLYQSLHTTVVGDRGQPFEVQIRTREMDLIAEEGIAAHWQYKQGKSPKSGGSNEDVLWLRQLLEWQKEVSDPREFLRALKIDLYPDEVYVFTPKGEVHAFPRGATALDFAYRIHTELGHRCSGARVNGKLVPLRTEIQNGDIIEIQTDANRKPSQDWLSFVATPRARSKIRQWLNTQRKLESQGLGKRMMEREIKKTGLSIKKVLSGPRFEEYLSSEGLGGIEDLYQKIAFGRTSARGVLEKLVDPEVLDLPPERPTAVQRVVDRFFGSSPVVIQGENDLMANLAKCCSPVPGDDVIGYITRGRGVSVHTVECPNAKNLIYDRDRCVEVEWGRPDSAFPVTLAIRTRDHQGMLARLTEVIAKESSNIRHCEAETGHGEGLITFTVDVKDRKHVERLSQAIRAINGVMAVDRRMSPTGRSRR